jgi:hypothetical protein
MKPSSELALIYHDATACRGVFYARMQKIPCRKHFNPCGMRLASQSPYGLVVNINDD